MVQIKSVEITTENSKNAVNKLDNLINAVKGKVVNIDAKSKVKGDSLKVPEEEYIYPNDHDEIVKKSMETQFGSAINIVKGTIIYSWGQEAPEKELPLEIHLDKDFPVIKMFGQFLSKQDFYTLYGSFCTLKDKILSEMFDVIKNKRSEFVDQIEMFPELLKSELTFMEIKLPIYSTFEDNEIELKIKVCGRDSENIFIQIDKNTVINICDLFFIYNKFDKIIEHLQKEK